MKIKLDDSLELFYTIDDFTDPWTKPDTVIMHHGMAKSHKMWFGWVPIIARHYRVIRFDMRGMGMSDVSGPEHAYTLDTFTADLKEFADKMELDTFHLIGETVGGSISMNYAINNQERLKSLTVCTSPTNFDAHHKESADLIDREGIDIWVEKSIGRRLDPQIVDPAYIRWYAEQMKATAPHVVSSFQRNASGDIGPMLKDVQTPMLMLAAATLREEVLGDFRGASDLFPNGRKVIFPGVQGFVQHIMPVTCARIWLDFAQSLSSSE